MPVAAKVAGGDGVGREPARGGLEVADGVRLPLDFVTSSNAILAKKGAGKTSAAVVLFEEMYEAGVPVIAIDPKGDWYGVRTSADGNRPGLPVPVFGGRHGDIPLEATSGELVADVLLGRQLSCVLDVSEFTKAEARRFLKAFGDRLYRLADRTPMHLFLEECHEYLPQQVRGEDAALVNTWQRIVKQGRFKGIGLTCASQRSASVNKDVLTQIDNLFVLRTTAPQDRDAVKAWIDIHADARSILAELPSLRTGECWLWQPERGEPLKFQFRRRHTFDAGTTPRVGEVKAIPTTIADVDLTEIAAAMAADVERTSTDDPAALRAEIAKLRRQLAAAQQVAATPVEKIVEKLVEVQLPPDPKILDRIQRAAASLSAAVEELSSAAVIEPPTGESARAAAPAPAPAPAHHFERPRTRVPVSEPQSQVSLRSGAHRMIETLGRMAPLRLTKSQWGTVARLRTTGGTWSTYLSDIRRAGFLDETSAGYTLTAEGFDYLGGRPAPMSPEELQQHYRDILRRGAAVMLDALIAAYPKPLTREQLGEAAELSTSGGTFSTYLSDLTRNGLAHKRGQGIVAADILMLGADTPQTS